MKTVRPCIVGLSLLASLVVQAPAIAAPVLNFDETTGAAGQHSDGTTVGWKFNVLDNIVVEGLGWFDEDSDGLATSHHIGIWSPEGNLLADVTVPAGTVAPLDGQFRTAAITPITLPAADGYIVGGLSSAADPERMVCGNSNVMSACHPRLMQTLDPRVQYVSANYSASLPALSRPTFVGISTEGYYGPSFSVQAIPEPTALILGLLAALGGVISRCRRPHWLSNTTCMHQLRRPIHCQAIEG